MSARATLVAALLVCGCAADDVELTLDIRESSDRRLFSSIETVHLRAEREGRTLVEEQYAPTVTSVSVRGVPYGPNTTFTLEGASASGDVIARGNTCPVDFLAPGTGGALRASLYFAPTSSFAPTVGTPLAQRTAPLALALPTGDILLSGGQVGADVVGDSEVFSVVTSRFVSSDATLTVPRTEAQAVVIDGVGALVTGGVTAAGASGAAISTAEIFRYDTGLYTPFDSAALGARVDHRAALLGTDSVLITGGSDGVGTPPLATTARISLQTTNGSATASAGPPMVAARRAHAMVVADGAPVVIGGYGMDGAPLASLEAMRTAATGGLEFVTFAQLRTARAEATATVLLDGTILVVGGAGDAAGTPLLDAEDYNPITQQTEVRPLAVARRGHSATLLPDGRVLIVGGLGADGAPLSSVELFIPDVGFVSERPLGTPRAGQQAITLCDGSVLVVGGGQGAELYVPPP